MIEQRLCHWGKWDAWSKMRRFGGISTRHSRDGPEIPAVRRVLLTFLALLLAGAIGAAWYVYDKGFTRTWRDQVSEEFRKHGVEVSLRRLTVDPFRGLVARDLKVFDARDRRRMLAVIDEMQLGVNYAALARGENFLETLDLREATLSLPVDPTKPGGPRVEISRLNARLFLPPQQIYLARAEAEVFGIQVSASGRLINPQIFWQQKAPGAAPGDLAARIVEEIKALTFEGPPPMISLTFTGDLAEPDKIVVDLAVWAERVRRENYLLQSLYIAAGYRNGVIDLKQFTATDAAGSLRITGTYRFDTRRAEMRFRSGIDLQSLAAELKLAPQLAEFVFYGAPALDFTANATFGDAPQFEIFGHIGMGRFAYRSVFFEALDADVSWDGQRWSARDVLLKHRTGEVRGDALQLPGKIRAKVSSTMNPKALQPLLSGKALEAMREFEFKDTPAIVLEARGSELSRDALTVSGDLKLGGTTYRGVPAESATAKFLYQDRVLTISPFHVERTEGGGGGGLIFNFKTDEVRLDKIRSNVNPPEVAMWFEPKLFKDIIPYRFRARPPNLFIDGLVHTKGGKSTRLTIDVDAPAGMDYTFLKKELRSPQISGKLLFTSDRLRITDLRASLFGGKVKGDADISLARNRPGHTVNMQVEGVDFASLTKLYFNYDNSKGRLTGKYDFSGRGSDARTMAGRGELSVTDGNVFAIPFLGPFSGILNTIVPGMGYNLARKANSTFTIRDGVIATDDVEIEGQGFSMYGSGKLFFLDDRMAFDMRINAQGLPGVLLFPVSKLFEYTADEKLSKPVWRPKVVPRFNRGSAVSE
jgi:hypothetical protein